MSHKTLKKRVIYSAFTTVLVLLCMEGLFRFLFWVNNREYHTSVYIQGNTLQMDDSLLVFRNRPFYLDYQHRFQYNEEGMKSAPGDVWLPKKQSNDYWVLLLGASTMEGMGSNKDGEWLAITGITDYPYNETIAWYLQQQLQEKMPDRKVRVFNAANSSFTIGQSKLRCELLLKVLTPDWVISLDGQNNPPALSDSTTLPEIVKKEWEQNPTKSFPLSWIIPLTSHSAFINSLKQYIYQRKEVQRLRDIRENHFPERSKWQYSNAIPIKEDSVSMNVKRAVAAYYKDWQLFDTFLTKRQQKHLLLLQPHILFRDPLVLDSTEKALYNYYTLQWNDPEKNGFLKLLRKEFPLAAKGHPSMAVLHETDTTKQPVFVDYCHFTRQTNLMVAGLLCTYLMKADSGIQSGNLKE